MFVQEIRDHLVRSIIPFWKGMRDDAFGGYYGFLGYDLRLDKRAVKGCILNSRILWFFSNAYCLLKDDALLAEADHAYAFLRDRCIDRKNGGIYWALTYDGQVADGLKHTYNQAFAIYALSSYYRARKDGEALRLAMELFRLVEEKCTDDEGYLEAFTEDFRPTENEKLSENGVMAEKTMNTLLHVFEAYTELYDVTGDADVAARLRRMLDLFAEKVYNLARHRLEVFFDKHWHPLIDLHSFGHDIEASWLIDRGCQVLGDASYTEKLAPITADLVREVYQDAYQGHSLANESENGVIDQTRVWWVQAEAVVGFLNASQQGVYQDASQQGAGQGVYQEASQQGAGQGMHQDAGQQGARQGAYLQAAQDIWAFIKEFVVDKRAGSEWYGYVRADGAPIEGRPIVEPWKCPYHNGRMCIEVIRRLSDAS